MTTQVLSLTRWEWFKLRRRWMPWILLAIITALPQLSLWGSVSGTFGSETEQAVRGADDVFLLFPNSVVGGLLVAQVYGIVLIMILAASLIGTEYGWGTLRTVLTQGTGRWPFLTSKLLLLALLGAAALLVGTAVWAVGSAIAMLTLGDGAWLAESADWIEVVKWCGKAVFGLLPYIALAGFVAMLTSSSGAAIGLSLGYYLIESILVGVLFNFDWFERVAEFLIGPAGYGWMGLPRRHDVLLSRRVAGRRPVLRRPAGLRPRPGRRRLLAVPAPRHRRRQGRVATHAGQYAPHIRCARPPELSW